MSNRIWKQLALGIPMAGLLLVSLAAGAGTISGKINGLRCAVEGTWCPMDRLDPYIATESDFVVVVSGGDFYYLPNLSRDIKVRHVLENVQVIGDVDSKYRTIQVEELHVKSGSEFKKVWSQEMQNFELKKLYGGGVGFPGQGK